MNTLWCMHLMQWLMQWQLATPLEAAFLPRLSPTLAS
jgi:hypothetical protein